MKKTFIRFCSVIGIMATFSACEKEEVAAPECQVSEELRKGSSQPTATVTYGERATAIDATIWTTQNGTVISNQSLLAETYFLPASGGTLSATLPTAEISGALTASALSASS